MIRSIEKALGILELLSANEGRELGLATIAETMGMDKGTCANIIKTLRLKGYIDQSAPRGGYKIGYKIYHLTGRAIENDFLTKIARSDVEALGKGLNETALLSVVRNDRRIILCDTAPDHEIIVRTRGEKSVYAACTGRVIIANYSPSHLEQFVLRLGLPSKEEWPEIYLSPHPEGELINALTVIKQDGYAIQRDSNGIVGFAAPLFREGHIAGAVGVYLPAERLQDEAAILSSVLACAREINLKIKRSGKGPDCKPSPSRFHNML